VIANGFVMEPKLSDYALIGNCRSAALVSRYGSIDWCCLPEFDSPSIFAAILDRQKGGHFSIAPIKPYQSIQKYIQETNVIETHFITDEGEVRLIDAFTVMSEEEKTLSLFPDHEILRVVEGIIGNVRMKLECAPRKYYGKNIPVLEDHKKLGIQFSWRENIHTLLSTLEPEEVRIVNNGDHKVVAEFTIRSDHHAIFSLSYSSQCPAVLPELKLTGLKRMKNTIVFWQSWIKKCTYTGLYANEVKRSALALKLLTYAPSGAIIAAPITSLPEELGGERNWDYRYCWLRDASFTTRVLLNLGFVEETHAYMNWILHATRLTRPRLQVVYSVFGHASVKEETLPWLSGYAMSKPVRIGNAADHQFQLDVYGEVLDAVYTYAPHIKNFDNETKKFLLGLGEVICETWDQPDNGIWEVRSVCVHHTHSKVMAWIGLDRLLKLCKMYHWSNAPLKKFKEISERIRDQVEQRGYSNELKTYTRELDGNSLDASVLTFSLVGYCDAASDRMVSTADMIYKHLSRNNLIYRYRDINDGLGGAEGAFGVCNYWLVENFAKSEQLEKAISVFETMLRHASPTGLLSEEIDPVSGDLLGNYPQGFSHIGLINAALTINEAYQKGAVTRKKRHETY
jgi:GH15 family glucan-1,4-alpha-glucosidase